MKLGLFVFFNIDLSASDFLNSSSTSVEVKKQRKNAGTIMMAPCDVWRTLVFSEQHHTLTVSIPSS